MKKELGILTLALAPALGLAQTAITGPASVTTVQCTLLQDDFRINLSTGVVGAWNCDTASGFVAVAACHTGGRRSDRTSVVNVPANCSGTDANSCSGTTTSTVTGAVVPNASTLGGSMGFTFGGTCDAAGTLAAGVL